jgi:hypothetical protein
MADSIICSCCLDDIHPSEAEALPCCHVFHRMCLAEFLRSRFGASKLCPVCRTSIRTVSSCPVEIIDWEALLESVHKDVEFVKEICQDLKDQLIKNGEIESIREAILNRDPNTICRWCDPVVSSLSYFCARNAVNSGRILWSLGRRSDNTEADWIALEAHFRKFTSDVDELFAAMDTFFSEPSNPDCGSFEHK